MKTEPIKEEVMSEEEEQIDDIELGPAMLGLQRVGTTTPKTTPTQPTQVLNARGMPARIRKKNKMFYDDALVNTPHHRVPSAKKPKMSPIKRTPKTPTTSNRSRPVERSVEKIEKVRKKALSPIPIKSPDRKVGQKIGLRLRNLLKLPKAHKWVCYEWFYSNIDQCLFGGDNDFQICLKESFPELVTRELTRIEWTKIRRMMGKPRRCSQAFFNQERLELEKKRNKIRALQQRKVTDLSTFQDLPAQIPMQLTVGTKVTARLRKPQDGLFTGSVDGVDTSNSTYRITFDRVGLGTHSVPDFEVLSNEPPEFMPLMNLPRRSCTGFNRTPTAFSHTSSSKLWRDRDPLLASYHPNRAAMQGIKAGYPIDLLEKMVLVRKILGAKRLKINLLKTMNQEAERLLSDDADIPEDFERRYAGILIDLEKVNKDLQSNLDEMQGFLQDIAHDSRVVAMLTPSHLREKCKEEGSEIVNKCIHNIYGEDGPKRDSIIDMLTDMTALLLQVRCLSDSNQNVFELQVIDGTMENMKRKESPATQALFQMHVECHMKYIEFGLATPLRKK